MSTVGDTTALGRSGKWDVLGEHGVNLTCDVGSCRVLLKEHFWTFKSIDLLQAAFQFFEL